jgi:phospholipid/cholesterol/gamma-HCH transport system substrate-binding protein
MTNDENKSFLGIKIQPGLDRYYELDVISDSIGVKNTEVDTTTPAGGTGTTVTQQKVFKNSYKFTGIFAKNFWDITLKGGIIENYGGVGIDYFPFGLKNLRLSTELYQFTDLQWRAFIRYNFFKGLYLIGGGDNLLSKDDRKASAFVGAGLFITNDDLKMLASKFSFK